MALKDLLGKMVGAMDAGAEGIDNLASGNLGAITQSVGWLRFMWWVRFLVIVLIIVVVSTFIWHYWLKYNKRVLIKKLKGNAVIDTYMDRGRIMKDRRGKTKLSLLRTRKTAPIPSYKYTTKMGKQDFYELYLDDKGNLYPINDQQIIDNITNHIRSDKNVDFHIMSAWRLEEMKLAEDKFRKKSFLQQHLPEILIFMAMVLGTVILWVSSKSAEATGVSMASAVAEFARSCGFK